MGNLWVPGSQRLCILEIVDPWGLGENRRKDHEGSKMFWESFRLAYL
jgi:hypothetical protein